MYNPDINPFPPELQALLRAPDAAPNLPNEAPPADNPAPMLSTEAWMRLQHAQGRHKGTRLRKRNKKIKAFRQRRKHKRRG